MPSDIDQIKTAAKKAGITRLCHFTQARTFFKIAQGKAGILSSAELAQNSADIYKPTDSLRLDGLKDHVCCSIEFPNTYYLKKARERDRVFRDWVVLLINPVYLWQSRTKFCAVNAATGGGAFIREGYSAFRELFVATPNGSRVSRSSKHRNDCPTDIQAEVLVPDRINIADIAGVCFESEQQARDTRACLKVGSVGDKLPPLFVCPQFFDVLAIRSVVRDGVALLETKLT
jgi:hypothetical protein